jgi:hypothetical protein
MSTPPTNRNTPKGPAAGGDLNKNFTRSSPSSTCFTGCLYVLNSMFSSQQNNLLTSNPTNGKSNSSNDPTKQQRTCVRYHGGLPMVSILEDGETDNGGLPGYCGLVEREEKLGFVLETWPQYRIGGSLWPSGEILGMW